jgi:hypothetical protein
MGSAHEWLRDKTYIGSNMYHTDITGQAIAKDLQYQNVWCFNSRKYGYLQRNWDQAKNFRSQNAWRVTFEKYSTFHWKSERASSRSDGFLNFKQKECQRLPWGVQTKWQSLLLD